jgi:Protein of unknown function (DUF4232)
MLVAALIAGADANARPTTFSCSAVVASTGTGPNGMTGGTYQWWVSITNRGSRACTIEGRPLVRIAPTTYPVTVADIAPGRLGTVREEPLTLQHGQSARAEVLVTRGSCNFTKRVARTLHVQLGWADARVTVFGEACVRQGASVVLGTFQR